MSSHPLRPFLLLLILTFSLLSSQTHAAWGVNPVKAPVLWGKREVHMRYFAQIPDYKGRGAKIVSIEPHYPYLYVCTSTSGAMIWRVSLTGKVTLWFNVEFAIREAVGRQVDFTNPFHGGVRSIAFHPNFAKNGLFYVAVMENRENTPMAKLKYFSIPKDVSPVESDSVVLEFRVDPKTRKPIRRSYRQVIRIAMPVYDHPIKQLIYRDNLLYIAHGDGSEQSTKVGGGMRNDGLGKILRINPRPSGGGAYSIPWKNPFIKHPFYKGEIYALGFRNPHNMCFSNKTGDLWVVDVGRDNVEEINIVKPGRNYGWPKREGPFVHKEGGGVVTGVGPLPWDDAKYGYTYPVAIVGHRAPRGASMVGQGLAGSCPIENGSPLNDLMFYANFVAAGELYYSYVSQMRNARTVGNPKLLWRAATYRARIFFDHDNNPKTPPKRLGSLRDVLYLDPRYKNSKRLDMRFGVGFDGEIYWSSKTNGRIYLITSSVPGAKV